MRREPTQPTDAQQQADSIIGQTDRSIYAMLVALHQLVDAAPAAKKDLNDGDALIAEIDKLVALAPRVRAFFKEDESSDALMKAARELAEASNQELSQWAA